MQLARTSEAAAAPVHSAPPSTPQVQILRSRKPVQPPPPPPPPPSPPSPPLPLPLSLRQSPPPMPWGRPHNLTSAAGISGGCVTGLCSGAGSSAEPKERPGLLASVLANAQLDHLKWWLKVLSLALFACPAFWFTFVVLSGRGCCRRAARKKLGGSEGVTLLAKRANRRRKKSPRLQRSLHVIAEEDEEDASDLIEHGRQCNGDVSTFPLHGSPGRSPGGSRQLAPALDEGGEDLASVPSSVVANAG